MDPEKLDSIQQPNQVIFLGLSYTIMTSEKGQPLYKGKKKPSRTCEALPNRLATMEQDTPKEDKPHNLYDTHPRSACVDCLEISTAYLYLQLKCVSSKMVQLWALFPSVPFLPS